MNLAHGPRRTYRINKYRTASKMQKRFEKLMNYLIRIALIFLTNGRRQRVTPVKKGKMHADTRICVHSPRHNDTLIIILSALK